MQEAAVYVASCTKFGVWAADSVNGDMSFHHLIRPRYGEIDMQGIVFNAHYLAYCDDASDSWFRSVFGAYEDLGWEVSLKRAEVTWHGPARLGDELDIVVTAPRFGTTSFDVRFDGSVDGTPVFEATVTYVCVTSGTSNPIPIPEEVRSKLGG